MKATVNEDLCCGCGPCEDICGAVFHIENGVAKVRVEPVPPDAEEDCRTAIEECPTDAISIQ